MPLRNRVDPFGELRADPARGLFMGNRGGRLHGDDRTLGRRRFVSRQWICCRLEFHGRHRQVWSDGYTELFFLDEPTAFAAGHRPCFECRRKDAEGFAECWQHALHLRARPRAAEMDRIAARRAAAWSHQAAAQAADQRSARRRSDRAGGGRLCRARRSAAALDARRLRRPRAPAARDHGRCAHAAIDPRVLAAATGRLASERR